MAAPAFFLAAVVADAPVSFFALEDEDALGDLFALEAVLQFFGNDSPLVVTPEDVLTEAFLLR
jgi:hypothetical protein